MMIYYISDVLKKTSKRRRYFSCTLKEELTFNPCINWASQERDEEACSPLPFQPKCALVSEVPPVDDQEQVDSFIQTIAIFALWAPNACPPSTGLGTEKYSSYEDREDALIKWCFTGLHQL